MFSGQQNALQLKICLISSEWEIQQHPGSFQLKPILFRNKLMKSAGDSTWEVLNMVKDKEIMQKKTGLFPELE